MMDFQKFTEAVLKGTREKADGKFYVSVTTELKNNGVKLTGISGIAKGSNSGPCVFLDDYYKGYGNGYAKLQSIIDEVYQQITIHQDDLHNINAVNFLDWDAVRKHIYMKLVNAEKNQELLCMVPHRIFLDLAVVYYVAISGIGEQGNDTGTIIVKDCHLPIWGQDEEGLYQSARENMCSDGKPVFDGLGNVLRCLMPEAVDLCGEKEITSGAGMYILTNNCKCYGASEILDKNTLKEISDKISGDFVILPSSVHEVIVLPLNYGMDYRELADMVKEINGTVVSPDEYLSDNVYVYVRSEGTLKLAA